MHLNGLVLTGGKSERMGQDKGSLDYHGKPQRLYLAALLKEVGCKEVYISVSRREVEEETDPFPYLIDQYQDIGPLAGLLTAFAYKAEVPWLVVACDYPLLDKATLGFLLENRAENLMATAFKNEKYGFPEPLITIYEPRIATVLQANFQGQQFSLSKILATCSLQLVTPPDYEKLQNVNTQEDYARIKDFLASNNQ